jgi:hypothetical protein
MYDYGRRTCTARRCKIGIPSLGSRVFCYLFAPPMSVLFAPSLHRGAPCRAAAGRARPLAAAAAPACRQSTTPDEGSSVSRNA